MSELVLKANELHRGDVILGWRHGDRPYLPKKNWVVKAPLGPLSPDGPHCVAMEKPDPDSDYELNLWVNTDIGPDTVFYVERGSSGQ